MIVEGSYLPLEGAFGVDNVVFVNCRRCRASWSAVSQYQFATKQTHNPSKNAAKERLQQDKELFEGGPVDFGTIKKLSQFTEKQVSSVEQCARFCSLGTACDMFFVKDEGNNMKCVYYAHTSLKQRPLEDILHWTGDTDDKVYRLQCSTALDTEAAANTDWFTHHKADWQETTSCPAATLGIQDERVAPSIFQAQVHGYQYSAASVCDSLQTYQLKKTITVDRLEELGLTQEYIELIKPTAYIRSFGRVLVGSATDSYNIKLTLLLANGTALTSTTSVKVTAATDSATNPTGTGSGDRLVTLPLSPLPLGDLTISAELPGNQVLLTPPELRLDLPMLLGCYTAPAADLAAVALTDPAMTRPKCVLHCHSLGKRFVLLAGGTDCFCHDQEIVGKLTSAEAGNCSSTCAGDAMFLCGGPGAVALLVAECQEGWTRFGESCFKGFTDGSLNADDAFNTCGEEGGTVWFPESTEETEWVSQVFR